MLLITGGEDNIFHFNGSGYLASARVKAKRLQAVVVAVRTAWTTCGSSAPLARCRKTV
jgi:hypothetical protein